MIRDPTAEWPIDPSDHPARSDDTDRLRLLLRHAVLTPLRHNVQTWMVRLRGDRVEVLADRTQALPVVDPQDSALPISCGVAMRVLRAAHAGAGRGGASEPPRGGPVADGSSRGAPCPGTGQWREGRADPGPRSQGPHCGAGGRGRLRPVRRAARRASRGHGVHGGAACGHVGGMDGSLPERAYRSGRAPAPAGDGRGHGEPLAAPPPYQAWPWDFTGPALPDG